MARSFGMLPALLLLAALPARAQEQFGLVHGNWSGPDALALDPTRSAGQWPYASVRLLGAGLFAWNDLVALNGADHSLLREVRNGIRGNAPAEVVLRESMNDDRKQGAVVAALEGPAFSLASGRNGFGVGVRTRAMASVTGIAPHLGRFIVHGLDHRPQHGLRYRDTHVRALAATWTELSLNYARILRATGFGLWRAGATVRYLVPHAGAALRLDVLDFTVVDTMRAEVHEVSGSYGAAMPAGVAGSGWGADLGISYERSMEEVDRYLPHRASNGCTPMPYRYRLAASLIDLGGMRFDGAVAGSVRSGTLTIPDHGAVQVQGIEGVDSLFAASGDRTPSTRMRIGAPTAVALLYDQRLVDRTYIALAWVQQLSARSGDRLRRPNTLAITPRFESRWFEAALPVVFHEYVWQRPSVGLMLRLGDLVIGSDHVLPFLFRPDVDAVDLYLRLRITVGRSPYCKGRRRTGRRHATGSGEALPCLMP
ncbi:MAG: hypothetical protein IT228_10395 [Flavobacteriales bacterium]|nr:hypothetical protein [Flavobacteriales bacterium]MCC6577739.1 hypothetical protein [Flavobacteriales bacterium]NUQ15333.1 hypothetical protein [Flavobacteriales bacterium]